MMIKNSKMARLLIGSSNVYCFHKLLVNADNRPYTMVRCTNQEVWNIAIDDINFEKGEVIISVIENLICDAVAEVTNTEARNLTIEDIIGSFMSQIKTTAQKKPGNLICISTSNAQTKTRMV
jgi:hypothetical protein